jgi:Pyruvate/2-oxoacid:ferredoxin oxidoreductase delta subunit
VYLPVIDEKKCNRCRACVKICPKEVFGRDEPEVNVWNPAYCTGCESCTVVCPEDAIKVEQM